VVRKRKRSRITQPKDGIEKEFMHAFRADRELTAALSKVSNKSETITDALRKYLLDYRRCPNCQGKGLVKKLKVKYK